MGLPARLALPHVAQSRSRLAITRQAMGEMSIPIDCRPRFWAATRAVPQPQNGVEDNVVGVAARGSGNGFPSVFSSGGGAAVDEFQPSDDQSHQRYQDRDNSEHHCNNADQSAAHAR
jgi:hypothetical protein